MNFDFIKHWFFKDESTDESGENLTFGGSAFGDSDDLYVHSDETVECSPQAYMRVSFSTSAGKCREDNQDSFFVDGKYRHVYGREESDCYIELTDSTHIFGVFDGMGGEAFGEAASAIACAHLGSISDDLRECGDSELADFMNLYSRNANNAICRMLEDRGKANGVPFLRGGSTFVAVCIKNGCIYPFYLGDSRIYLLSDKGLEQITEDQTLAVRKIKAGIYTEEEARGTRDEHTLTCFLGADRTGTGIDSRQCTPIPIRSGMKLLLCSDGLTDMCSHEEIERILGEDSGNMARLLTDTANAKGGIDNVTCVVAEFFESFGGLAAH